MSERIPLVNDRGFALVDECDLELVSQYRWHEHPGRHTSYAAAGSHRRRVYMHRLILGAPKGMQVDHIDGDGLNNLRSNLRLATHAENQANRRVQNGTTSPYVGVYWANRPERRKQWRAQIKVDGRTRCLGDFLTEREAALAYNAAALELRGEFARLNVID